MPISTAAGRQQLGLGGKGFDSNWVNNYNGVNFSTYESNRYNKSKEYIEEDIDFPNNQATVAYGGYATFNIDRRIDKSSRWELSVTRSALTCGAGGVNPCFNDFEGYSSIDYIEFTYANVKFHLTSGEMLFQDMVTGFTMNRDQRQTQAQLQAGYLSRSRRVANAKNPLNWIADLQVPWDDLEKKFPHFAIPDDIKVKVQFKNLIACTLSADVPVCNILSCVLRLHGEHLIADEQSSLWNQVNSGEGIKIKMTSSVFQNRAIIPTGTTGIFKIKMPNIKNSVIYLIVTLRPTTSLDVNATLDLQNYVLADQIYLTDNGTAFTVPRDITANNFYLLNRINRACFPDSQYGLPMMVVPFVREEHVMASKNHCLGDRDFSEYNNCELNLVFNSAISSALYCDIRAVGHNVLEYNKGFVRTEAALFST